jgi:hypothetical protein
LEEKSFDFFIEGEVEAFVSFFDPFLKADIYDQPSLCLMHPWEVSDGPTLARKNPAIFMGDSVA